MAGSTDILEREKIARAIEKTSESIRKKHRALKTGRIEDDIAVKRHLGPIIEPLQRIVDNSSTRAIKDEPGVAVKVPPKREPDVELVVPLTPNREKKKKNVIRSSVKKKRANDSSDRESNESKQPRTELSDAPDAPTITSTQHTVYGVYLDSDGMKFGSLRFEIDNNDNILLDNVRYKGTPGLYELIFKRHPDEDVFTDNDLQKYRSMLLVTNAYRRNHSARGQVKSNRGYKYKYIIAPLLPSEPTKKKKSGQGLPRTMTLNDNAIDYVHWDDPNELVDRL
ncbi:hypothetical protein X777_12477 [Ooceraea biroi]|uniref:DUF8207 domain-containing protein n=1 Tax=Ooceraea biroi TaxID=2015173 RepID=A0A026VZP9_OOCBI|nr:hypothetical protein X777_12477 [Ooceraea biroi]